MKKKRIIIIIILIGVLVLLGIIYYICFHECPSENTHEYRPEHIIVKKPVIYLYPKEEIEVTVRLKYEENIEVAYPRYENGWKVISKPNGDLIDLNTKRNLYALYYESKSKYDFKIEEEGFLVKGEEIINFLEEKLTLLGLNEKEEEEFIIYWFPILKKNKYNYIRFATNEEITKNMPLEFSKDPDTLIRVLMTYKGLNKEIDVKEQQITTPERIGFTVVEWGGIEIK